jgi:Transposase IS116/IS110/IS902 family
VERYPTLKLAQTATPEELTQFFRSHQVVRRSAMIRRIEQIATSGIPLTEDPGIVEPMQWLVQTLIGQLKPLLLRLNELPLKIDNCFTALPDAAWFAALPGAGEHLAPRLLAAFGEDRSRFDNAQQRMCYFGIAPVKESSGKQNWVHWKASPEGGFPSVGNWRAGVALSFSDKRLSSGRTKVASIALGLRLIIEGSVPKETPIPQPCAHSHSNGFGSYFAAGKMVKLMRKPSM